MAVMKRSTLVVLASLILIGMILRFYNIGFQVMNYDEEFTIMFAGPAVSVARIFFGALTQDFTPPLFYLVAHLSMSVFGETATAIRIPSAIFGILLIPVSYLIGTEYKDELLGLVCAGFTTTLYTLVYYSDFGRSYSLAILLVAMSSWFFLRICRGDTHSSVPFGISAVLAFWTHLYTVFPLGVLVLYLFWKGKSMESVAISILGSSPLIIYIPQILYGRVPILNQFGASPAELVWKVPLELYGYAAVIIVPVIVYSLWLHHDTFIEIMAVASGITVLSLFLLTGLTAIIPHYAIWVVILLLVPVCLPFYTVIKTISEDGYFLYVSMMVITLLNGYQIYLFHTYQRWILG